MALNIEEQTIWRHVGGQGCSQRKMYISLTEDEIRRAYYAYKKALDREFISDSVNEALSSDDTDSDTGSINTEGQDVIETMVEELIDIATDQYIINVEKYDMSGVPAMQDAIRTAVERTHPDWTYAHGNRSE